MCFILCELLIQNYDYKIIFYFMNVDQYIIREFEILFVYIYSKRSSVL